jgi:hypothetical protein
MRIDQFLKTNQWFDSAILIVFILAFAGATYNHAMDLFSGGMFPYTKRWGTPEIFNIYWTSLTILDPLSIGALIINIRVGYVVAILIMLTDVPINLYVNANYWQLAIHENRPLLMQIAFLIFLLSTVRSVWKRTAVQKRKC